MCIWIEKSASGIYYAHPNALNTNDELRIYIGTAAGPNSVLLYEKKRSEVVESKLYSYHDEK